jgi:hypothetical protein
MRVYPQQETATNFIDYGMSFGRSQERQKELYLTGCLFR